MNTFNYKKCSKCKFDLPRNQFNIHSRHKDGLQSQCKNCKSLIDKKYRIDNKEAKTLKDRIYYHKNKHIYRNQKLKKAYGITIEDYNILLKVQDHKCKICKSKSPGIGKGKIHFDVDHDHFTKKVRGLLCRNCNKALGMFKDDPHTLFEAIEYLTKG